MKYFSLFLAIIFVTGCAGTHRRGVSRFDEYDAVKVEQMVGNNVSTMPVFQKVIVCLNARRETRQITVVTNIDVQSITNLAVVPVTNAIITLATNSLVTTMTNLAPPILISLAADPGESSINSTTNAATVVNNSSPSVTTNLQVSLSQNQSLSTAPHQTAVNSQLSPCTERCG